VLRRRREAREGLPARSREAVGARPKGERAGEPMSLQRKCIICPRPALPGTSSCEEQSLRRRDRSNWSRYRSPHAEVYKSAAWKTVRARAADAAGLRLPRL
jgi:hypothetical protein